MQISEAIADIMGGDLTLVPIEYGGHLELGECSANASMEKVLLLMAA